MTDTEQEVVDQPRCWRLASQVAQRERRLLPGAGVRVAAVGCGTSYFVAQAFAAMRERAGLGETDAFAASEMPLGRRYDVVLLITRSGTTSEVLELAPRLPKEQRTLAITADAGTPVTSLADDVLVLDFADESSIVQTRFATSVLALLRTHLGADIEPVANAAEHAVTAALPLEVPRFEQFVFLGRGDGVGLANEAALKMRETARAWAEAYPALELRHGPISTLGADSVVWCLGSAPDGLAEDVRATGATWVNTDHDPLVALVLVQRVAIATALTRGLDPDRPRFLSRSVILSDGHGAPLG